MKLSSLLIRNKRADLLEACEQLFLIKITEAFKKLGTGDHNSTLKLLKEAVEIFKPMEGIIELIIKNVIPNHKNESADRNPVNIINEGCANIKSYAEILKEKIADSADRDGSKNMLAIFDQFNKKELYDSELISYKAVLLMSEELYDAAELEIKQGLLKYPNDIRLLCNLSRLYSITQRFKKSIEVYCRVKILYKDKCTLEIKELVPDNFLNRDSSRVGSFLLFSPLSLPCMLL
jgi:hypothetical protein